MRQAKEESQVKLKKKKVIDQSVCGRIRISYCGQLGINHNGYCGRPCIACLTVSEMKDKEVEIRSLFTKSSSVISYGLPPRSINCLLLLVACCLYTVGIPPKPKKKKKILGSRVPDVKNISLYYVQRSAVRRWVVTDGVSSRRVKRQRS